MEQARKHRTFVRGVLVTAAVFLLTILILVYGAARVNRRSSAAEAAALEDGVRRAAILHYAVEGRYPKSAEELRQRYGLRYNEKRYIVHIDSFAENLLPDIRVLTVGGDANE